jgi:WD40 repeat protein
MEGGSSGPVIVAGDPDGSRLMRLITQQEEPFMPPSGTPMPPEEIEIIRKWIADGAPADSSAKPMAAKSDEAAATEQPTFVAATFADTPPMPEVQLAAATPVGDRGQVARALDASPRAPILAVGSSQQILLYNIETFQLMGALPFPEGEVFTLTFSVNGELLLAGGGEEGFSGTCALYNVRTGERLGTFGEFWDTVLAADVSPDHRMVAVGGPEKKVKVYSTETREQLYEISDHNDWIYAVRFTPDGEVLATADRSGGLFLWQAANGRAVEQLRGHEGAIHALEYTADSVYLASAGADGTVHVWDTWKYTKVRSFKAHAQPVLNLDISASNQILTTSADRTTKLWDIEGKELASFQGLNDWGYQARAGRKLDRRRGALEHRIGRSRAGHRRQPCGELRARNMSGAGG